MRRACEAQGEQRQKIHFLLCELLRVIEKSIVKATKGNRIFLRHNNKAGYALRPHQLAGVSAGFVGIASLRV